VRSRVWGAVAAGFIALILLLTMAAPTSLVAALPSAVGGATLAGLAVLRPGGTSPLAWLLVLPGLASQTMTVWVLATGYEPTTGEGLYGLVEVAILVIALAAIVRWLAGPQLVAGAVITGAAQVTWILRFLPDRGAGELVAGCALWSVPSVIAVVVGGYPRVAAARLRSTVSRARAEQRRSLERDLHDYVAHDVTAMVAQAQAARFAAGDDPRRLRGALRRIEESGQRALTSMDRALALLREDDREARGRALRNPGVEELPRLVATFGTDGSTDARLTSEGPTEDLPREVSETLYRVCVESLTNVLRHAKSAGLVSVDLTVAAGRAALTVRDDGRPPAAGRLARARSGTGLLNSQARVEALGGTFHAGPLPDGWQVRAQLPYAVRTPG
jgi:signal transduction histidine kinase